MHDNATPHTSQSTHKFLEDKNIDVLEWPPHSPECNPIEHLWAILVRRIYEGGKEYRTNEDLKNAIKRVWEYLEIELIQKLVRNFPKRLIQVVANRGVPTRTY